MQEELDELGQQMAARKAELMVEMGLEEEGEEGMPAGTMPRRAKGTSAQRGAR